MVGFSVKNGVTEDFVDDGADDEVDAATEGAEGAGGFGAGEEMALDVDAFGVESVDELEGGGGGDEGL